MRNYIDDFCNHGINVFATVYVSLCLSSKAVK